MNAILAQGDFYLTQVVIDHHLHQLFNILDFHRPILIPERRNSYRNTMALMALGNDVSTRGPSGVTSTSSSILTPPTPGRYMPGSTVTTIPLRKAFLTPRETAGCS